MIRIAIQAKGRLNEQSMQMLNEAGMSIDDDRRKYLCKASHFPLEVLYLRDDDIPQTVAAGVADLGIVGLNEVEERGCRVDVAQRLGFGRCRLSLAVPKSENYTSLDYFAGRRIATSYPNILSRFLHERGVEAKVCCISGSVEIAPAVNIADAIFDIVSSGGTLLSNGLVEVERVLESEAVLIANPELDDEKRQLLDRLMFRLEAVIEARSRKYVLMNLPSSSVEKALTILPALRSPTILPLAAEGWCSMHSVVDADRLWEKVTELKAIGAEGILVLDLEKIIK